MVRAFYDETAARERETAAAEAKLTELRAQEEHAQENLDGLRAEMAAVRAEYGEVLVAVDAAKADLAAVLGRVADAQEAYRELRAHAGAW
jgi:chromosome segregation ATPase